MSGRKQSSGYITTGTSRIETCYCGEPGSKDHAINLAKPNQPGQRGRVIKVLFCSDNHRTTGANKPYSELVSPVTVKSDEEK